MVPFCFFILGIEESNVYLNNIAIEIFLERKEFMENKIRVFLTLGENFLFFILSARCFESRIDRC